MTLLETRDVLATATAPPFLRAALTDLPAADRELFERFGRGAVVEPSHHLVHAAFEAHAARQPDAVAVDHLGETITYGDLDAAAEQLADRLVRLGVVPGACVGLFLRRSIPMVVGMLATLKVGAAYVPQDAAITPDVQLRHVVSTTSARVVLTSSEHADSLPSFDGAAVVAVDAIVRAGVPGVATLRPRHVTSDANCFVLFTSGTTGRPNGVQVTHRNVCNILLTDPGRMGMQPGKRVAQLLNIAFDMAAWETLGALANGATLVIRGSDFAEAVARADIVIATPSVLARLDPAEHRHVEVVAVAGEPCPRPLADAWGAFAAFHNSCGPTETTIVNTVKRYRPGVDALTIGAPTPNNTVYVLDEHLRPCRIGDVGEMWAGGDCVTAGYLCDPELTAERYRPDPFLGDGRLMFRTRDLGRWTADGELEHLGRTDDQVKVRGFRVELDSVSRAMEATPGCTKAVTLRLDKDTLVGFVQPADVDVDAVARSVADRLPYYCVPATITALNSLPVTERGKVDKRALANRGAAPVAETSGELAR